MGCNKSKVSAADQSTDKHLNNYNDNYTKNNSIITEKTIAHDDMIIANLSDVNDHISILIDDPQSFNNSFIEQRQQAISNQYYQSAINSFQPKSLQHLTNMIKSICEGKSLIDTYWVIYNWIIHNIKYDSVAYMNGKCADQSPEEVFRKRKGISSGYSNLYKYLCDQLEISCEIINGYAKGYEFENGIDISNKNEHKWNAIQIDNHWYLIESTWGAGYLNENRIFQHEPNSYYFCPLPNQMIYHHLPKNDQWQLLKIPIKVKQYLKMPHLHPLYFDLNIELISPHNQYHLNLIPGKPYALILIKVPSDVHIVAEFKLNNKTIDDGSYIMFDKTRQIYRCYFSPINIGRHNIYIYGKKGSSILGEYRSIMNFILDIKQMPLYSIRFTKTSKNFSDFDLEVIYPRNTNLIKLNNENKEIEILIKTPEYVELSGHLKNEQKKQIIGGEQIYYDQEKNIWKCKFAPDRIGLFQAIIMAKKKTNMENYTPAMIFNIEAEYVPSPPISYPISSQLFYDLGLKIKSPRNSLNPIWLNNSSYTEILLDTPNDIQLSSDIRYGNIKIENGSLTQFNHEKKLWQLLFAPERTGQHELIVYAKNINDNNPTWNTVVKFNLNVTKLKQPMKFPVIYDKFRTTKCQIYTPIQGILKKESVVTIHCAIPDAKAANLSVDSRLLSYEGYQDSILERQIQTGSKDIIIYAKYGQNSSFDALIKYNVQ